MTGNIKIKATVVTVNVMIKATVVTGNITINAVVVTGNISNKFEGFRPEWCISTIYHASDTPF